MGKTLTQQRIKDFLILGPTLARDNKVLEAIHALYFLPENFKMIFTGNGPVDETFYGEVVSLVERDALADRVHFSNRSDVSDAVIEPHATYPKTKHGVTGDSPEALASAILNVARTAV